MDFFNKYQWLLFDFDNTLADFTSSSNKAFKDVFSDVYTQNIHHSFHEINSKYWHYFEKGKITGEELHYGRFKEFLETNKLTNFSETIADNYLDGLLSHSIWIDGAKEMIQKLSATHNIAIVTNGLQKIQHKRIKKLGIDKYNFPIFISEELNSSKPNNLFFEKVHHAINSPAKNSVLVIGDNPKSDIKGGKQFGYHTCYFQYHKNKRCTVANYTIKSWKNNA